MRLTDLLPETISLESLIVTMAGLAAAFTVLAVWQGLLVRNPVEGRLKSLARRREALMSDLRRSRRHQGRMRQIGFMHRVVDRLKLLRNARAKDMADKLAKAGWRSRDALVAYLFFKLCLPAVFGATAAVVLYVFEAYSLQPLARLGVTLGSVVLGLYAPDIFIKNAVDKRRNKIRKSLPDALDLMVICAEAGLTLDAALKRVSREMVRSNPDIADEFGLTAVELGFLQERAQALRNLTRRVDLPAVRGVVNTLMQTERYGTPLAQSLRVLSAEYRNERLMRAEEKAARLPAIMTVPMIIFVLPPLFIVLLGPGVISFIDALIAHVPM